jgi:hypothetical protein
VARVGEIRNAYKIWLENPKLKAPFGCDWRIFLFIYCNLKGGARNDAVFDLLIKYLFQLQY